ncbi:MAG: hypothetical protein J6Q54_01675, partial [Oscillospiraceae bacterium]|nr:hypothetical protein [Oscillospiraceae bacterium]
MKTYSPIPKKLLSIALCLAMLMTMLPMPLMAEAAETAATTITPHIQTDERTLYKIGDLDDLKAFRDLVNSGQTNVDAYLTSDINLNGEAWTPIGLAEKPYAGHFDGRGRTISGLSLTGEYTNMAIGLFGYIQGAGIRSLKVSGTNSSTVTSDSNIIASRGLLVGTMVDSILYNCLVSGEMSGSGIVAGSLAGLAQHSIIIDCGSTATLNCADLYMGGLVGYMTAGYDAALCLLNSYCTGNVTHTNTNGYAGGLVGCLFDDAVNNVYTGTVAGNVTSGAMGTLFGYVGNTLQANSNDTTTITFNPVIERNYYLGDALPIGLTSTGMDTTNFASVYTASTLQTTLNDGLDTVNAIIEGHRGYLSTTQWAELVAALDGESVEATQWTVKSGVPSHVIHTLRSDCYCSVCKAYEHTFDADGICIYCKSFQSPDGTGKRSDPYKIGNLGQLYSYAGKALDANYSYGEL